MKRKEGYYWVKRHGMRKLEIALWANGSWWLPMHTGIFDASDFKWIDEPAYRIKPEHS